MLRQLAIEHNLRAGTIDDLSTRLLDQQHAGKCEQRDRAATESLRRLKSGVRAIETLDVSTCVRRQIFDASRAAGAMRGA